jgi:hypothetical protein
LWGEDRITKPLLLKLDIQHSPSTTHRCMMTDGRSPSNTGRSFLHNHGSDRYALDLTSQVLWDFSI